MLRGLVEPVAGDLYCHAPADLAFELAALARPDDRHDRWSTPGTATIYLAGDSLVALAEYARHGDAGQPDERRIVRVTLRPTPVLDLRRADVAAALGLDLDACGSDRAEARSVASALRESRVSAGLIVPSMAFRDDPDRLNVVLFAEALGPLADVILDPTEVGRVTISG